MGTLTKRLWSRRGGRGIRGILRAPAAIALVFLLLIPLLPEFAQSGSVETLDFCSCGCGKVKGECCCAAPRISRLEFGCSNSEDPNDPLDGTSVNKIIGPPDEISLVLPVLSDAVLTDPSYAFAGLDPHPEIPPPRT